MRRLRVGVPEALLALPPVGGHGRVWHRVLRGLDGHVDIVQLHGGRGPWRRGPDVVLASGHDALPAVQAPVVAQIHEAGWFEPSLRAVLDSEFLEDIAAATDRAVRAADEVIVPAQAVRADVIAAYGLDPQRVHAVPHGVEAPFCAEASGGRAIVAGAHGSPAPYVLHAAMLHPRKNLDALRQAMAKLAGDGMPHLLVVAGLPPADRHEWEALRTSAAAELPGAPGRVVYLGQPSDEELAALMGEADAFCLPSLYEGFGLTALEAMACGAPAIVSDRGALPEVVGDAGLVVEPSATAIAQGLAHVLSDQAESQQLAAAGVARAREFSWERTAAGWFAVLRKAAGRP